MGLTMKNKKIILTDEAKKEILDIYPDENVAIKEIDQIVNTFLSLNYAGRERLLWQADILSQIKDYNKNNMYVMDCKN
ncbi:MAG: hypothetical protein HDT44_05085 [Ruminococcaceae bacterium]|nr:hypothetical protein [Oscillospiraceae bacterium]